MRPLRRTSHRHTRRAIRGVPSLALALALALCVPTGGAAAQTLIHPGSPLQRSPDGIFSSLIPRETSGSMVLVHGGNIPGRVYGGTSRGQGLVGGNTVIALAGAAARGVAGGFNAPSEAAAPPREGEAGGSVEGNSVFVLGGTFSGAVGGGANGEATGNAVTITGGRVTAAAAGALSLGDATGNLVTIAGGVVETEACGAISQKGAVTGNRVLITGEALVRAARGGGGAGRAYDNSVLVVSGRVEKDVIGGQSALGSATGNRVRLAGGQVDGRVAGGVSDAGEAAGNRVRVDAEGGAGPVLCAGDIVGGESAGGAADGNSLELLAGMLYASAAGGQGSAQASGNTVVMAGGTVEGTLAGGRSHHQARDNTVIVRGGLARDITGGLTETSARLKVAAGALTGAEAEGGASEAISAAMGSEGGAAQVSSGNTVRLEAGTVWGTVTGGHSQAGSATGNTVELCEGAALSDMSILRGGSTGSGGDAFTGNTLVVEGGVMAGSLENFATLTFVEPPSNGSALLLAGRARLSVEGATTTVLLKIDGDRAEGRPLPASFTLLRADGGIDLAGGALAPGQRGLAWGARLFDVRLAIEGDALVAHVENVR